MNSITNVVIGLVTLGIMCAALFFGAAWLFSFVKGFGPKVLALFSLGVIIVPFIVLVVYFQIGSNETHGTMIGVITMLSVQLGFSGLVVSGVWYLIRRFWN